MTLCTMLHEHVITSLLLSDSIILTNRLTHWQTLVLDIHVNVACTLRLKLRVVSATLFAAVGGLSFPLLRSLMSNMVGPDEQGECTI